MPIYDFICQNCGEKFDLLTQHNWRAAGAACPTCGSADLEKEVSRVGAFASGGKIQMMDQGHQCGSCHTGSCSTCH
jgi:putative FmdB family regulatory protein